MSSEASKTDYLPALLAKMSATEEVRCREGSMGMSRACSSKPCMEKRINGSDAAAHVVGNGLVRRNLRFSHIRMASSSVSKSAQC